MNSLQYKVNRWTNNLLFVVAFTLPLIPRFQLPFLILMLILFFLNKQKQGNWFKVTGNWPAILMISFYLYHIVGLLWTDNLGTALLDLQIKLPLLILPLTIYYGKQIEKSVKFKVCSFFVYGIEAAIYFCIMRAIYFYMHGNSSYFLYKEFSFFIHPGYFSMFVCFATVIILQRVLTNSHMVNFLVAMHWYRIFLFTGAIILLSSKAGIFIQILIFAVAFVIALRKRHSTNIRNYGLPAMLAALVLYFGLFSPLTSLRMNEMEETLSHSETAEVHSSAMRLQAWQSSVEIIEAHPLKGAGTGDAKSYLLERYDANGFIENYTRKLNSHNQFLQTAVALGIPCLILLGSIFIIGLYESINAKNWLFLMFLLVTGANFMVEAMLEVTAGTLYFGLFYVLLSDEDRN